MTRYLPHIVLMAFALLSSELAAETVTYSLAFSLGGRGMEAGTATFSETADEYEGNPVIMSRMTMSTNRLTSLVFMLRDTLTSVMTADGLPLHYSKQVNERSRHAVETAGFMHSTSGCDVHLVVRRDGRVMHDVHENSQETVYDMLSMLHHARYLDANGVGPGDEILTIPMVNGELVVMQHILFEGTESVTDGDGTAHECLRLSVRDYKYGDERETMKVFVTNDALRIPVRMDIVLGSAAIKAVMKEYIR